MNFPRAFTIALMVEWLVRSDGSIGDHLAVAAVGLLLWWFAPDPTLSAVERGLEAFARKYRR